MKTLWIKLFSIVLFSTLLSGCFSSLLFNNGETGLDMGSHRELPKKTVKYEEELATDQVTSLVKDNETQNIIVVGKQYLIYLDNSSSAQIQKLVDGQFSNAFYVNKYIEVITSDYRTITTKFSLKYKAPNDIEKEKIKQLGFDCTFSKCDKEYQLSGELYNNTNKLDEITQVQSKVSAHPLSFKLILKTTEEEYDRVRDIAGKIAKFPLAVALDVVTLPLQIMLFIGSR